MKKKPSAKTEAIAGKSADQISQQLCHRVKELRAAKGWSLEALSTACGVSRSMLSQVERNETNPTLAVAVRIAQAFGMSLGELIESPENTPSIHVIRADDRQYHYRSDETCRLRTLSPLHLEKDVEFYELELKPGGVLRSSAHFEGTREFVTVQQGKLRITSGDDVVEVSKGDSASFRADVAHCLENAGRADAIAFLVVIYQ